MKTWEMIKELTEHPEKKFRCLESERWCFEHLVESVVWNGNNAIAFKGDDGDYDLFSIRGTLDWNWEEVIEPVDFLTAYNDCLENGTTYIGFKCDRWCGEDQTMSRYAGCMVTIKDKNGASVFLDCKWIKEV